jgi:putative SOS response-associated peptidase YedK
MNGDNWALCRLSAATSMIDRLGRNRTSTGTDGNDWIWSESRRRAPIMLAEICDRCETTDQGLVESCTFATQPSGAPLDDYHDRAPVVLFVQDWSCRLDVGADVGDLLGLRVLTSLL